MKGVATGGKATFVDLDPHVETTTLDNGLAVTTVALPHLHTAVCALFVKVGARFETPADNGLSHFVEHMLYRGTERYPTSLALNTAVERLGSTLHAETGRHDSLFQLALEPANIDAGIELLGELMTRPRFSEIELERELVLEELNEDYDEHDVEVNPHDIARGIVFQDHPLGQRIIGPRENVRRFTEADVRRHFAAFYGARNASLCVAGPVEHGRIVESAQRHMAAMTPGRRAELDAAPAPIDHRRMHHVRESGSQTSLSFLFRAIPELDPRFVAQAALLRVLDDGMSTRLHYTLSDQKGLAYAPQAGVDILADTALFEITASTANAKVPTLVREVLALLDGLRAGKVADDELAKVRVRFRYDALATLDDAGAMAGTYGATPLYYPLPPVSQQLAQMAKIKVDDIVEAAHTVLAPDHLVLAAVGTLSRARLGELRQTVTDWR
jgi:predicted Zn-dependent peptidase